jgi:hypothetical protein
MTQQTMPSEQCASGNTYAVWNGDTVVRGTTTFAEGVQCLCGKVFKLSVVKVSTGEVYIPTHSTPKQVQGSQRVREGLDRVLLTLAEANNEPMSDDAFELLEKAQDISNGIQGSGNWHGTVQLSKGA